MREGLYKAEFKTPFGTGVGVMFLHSGKVSGGNSALYYTGGYSVKDDHWEADIVTRRHTLNLNVASVFGLDLVHVTMDGTVKGDEIIIEGVSSEVPDMQMHGKLIHLSD